MSDTNADLRATGRHNPESQQEPRKALDARILRYLETLSAEGFFGKVIVSFQNGRVTDVRTEQTRKLEEL